MLAAARSYIPPKIKCAHRRSHGRCTAFEGIRAANDLTHDHCQNDQANRLREEGPAVADERMRYRYSGAVLTISALYTVRPDDAIAGDAPRQEEDEEDGAQDAHDGDGQGS